MKLSILTLAVFSAFTTALPTTSIILEPVEVRSPLRTLHVQPKPAPVEIRGDGRAATIFKNANLGGESTFIPSNPYCTDISNIFGGFDGKVRSLSVAKGFKCDFYQEAGCDVNDFVGGGAVLEVGFRNKKDERRQLGSWASKIASVYCQKL